MKKRIIAIITLLIVTITAAQNQKNDSLTVAKIFEGHSGAFVMLDMQKEKYFRFNAQRCSERFLPASTFKIPNSLIGLETGIITDENFIIKWDGIKRWNEEWNKDHSLATAIKYSVVPYYQELARRVGREKLNKYLKAISYGNHTIGKKVDMFWLDNSLKISADEQISFLKRLYEYNLPFSKRSIDIVKKIMPEELYSNSRLKFKTGTGTKENGTWIGWLVGYVEKKGNVYLFAFNIEAKTYEETRDLRDGLSRKILTQLKIIE
ncbi:MAG: class D beta-lactamase [Ignavibacteriales bacterium]|nr:class D beta-lactamase [Ignavibacteriales bacterium]